MLLLLLPLIIIFMALIHSYLRVSDKLVSLLRCQAKLSLKLFLHLSYIDFLPLSYLGRIELGGLRFRTLFCIFIFLCSG